MKYILGYCIVSIVIFDIYRFNVISTEIAMIFSTELEQIILSVYGITRLVLPKSSWGKITAVSHA